MKVHIKTTKGRFLRRIAISARVILVLLLSFVATSAASASGTSTASPGTFSLAGTAFCRTGLDNLHPCDKVKVTFRGEGYEAIPYKGWWGTGRFKVEGIPFASKGEHLVIYTERQAGFDTVQCPENYIIIKPVHAYDLGKDPWPRNAPCINRPHQQKVGALSAGNSTTAIG
jgi:hypothetical protein